MEGGNSMDEKKQDLSSRHEEWLNFQRESMDYPIALAEVEEKLLQKIKKQKRAKRTYASSFSVAAVALLFILLVNTSAAFAHSIANIPILAQLAEYVRFDKTLTLAIENEYVQEVNLTAWYEDYQLNIPYVLADEKNLILFFQFPEDFPVAKNEWLSIRLKELKDANTGQLMEGFSSSSQSFNPESRQESQGFLKLHVSFGDTATLPQNIEIKVDVKSQTINNSPELIKAGSDSEDSSSEPEFIHLGSFTYKIKLNEFAEPIHYDFHEEYSILGQIILLEKMSIYPTGTEVQFTFPEENTAWIKGLDLAVQENEDTILQVRGGISGYHDEESKWMSVFIESDYFRQPQGAQKLLIKGVRLLNKEEEYITVDLNSKTITPEIAGLTLDNVEVKGDKANLTFQTEVSSDAHFGMLSFKYKDSQGNNYDLDSQGSFTRTYTNSQGTEEKKVMETYITVVVPEDGYLIFQRSLTPLEQIDSPLAINLPQRD